MSIKGFTIIPNYIIADDRISMGAKMTWQVFAMRNGLKNWVHHLKPIANMLNRHIDTIRDYVKELIKYGYLNRRRKDNQEFGYIYSIPQEHLTATFASAKNTPVEETSMGVSPTYNKKDLTNTDLNNKRESDTPPQSKINSKIKTPLPEQSTTPKTVNQSPRKSKKKKCSEDVVSPKDLVPQGEWKDTETGWFKREFLEWKAKWAIAQFNDLPTLSRGIIWTENHFTNHPEKIAMYWMQYQREQGERTQNAHLGEVAENNNQSDNVKQSLIEIPINPRAKFTITLMPIYQKLGGKGTLGDFGKWCESEFVDKLFEKWQRNN